ncbi:hypothetical protein Patl1_12293 [Pistacia atlantica]|uniref:Uncharacterized protein n=1 Tax=Pistacia atlantica TaxID=434234 RepID=A0ACC1A8U3_9ROSI|nr:hypothetical protein Patl1_12293 [Pistacia atlantica]
MFDEKPGQASDVGGVGVLNWRMHSADESMRNVVISVPLLSLHEAPSVRQIDGTGAAFVSVSDRPPITKRYTKQGRRSTWGNKATLHQAREKIMPNKEEDPRSSWGDKANKN